jgi:hypothetical protein
MMDCVELREYADRMLESESEGDFIGCGSSEGSKYSAVCGFGSGGS